MYKLIKAGWFRLKKDTIFFLFMFLSILIAIFTLIKYKTSWGYVILDEIMNEFITYIGLFIAIFVSIFVGKEHSEGIIRNKIIAGHSRMSIYLSNLIITVIAAIICELIYIIITLLIGIPFFGTLRMNFYDFLLNILCTFLIIISFCSIYNFITMICSEITISTIINILIFIIMFILASSLGYVVHSSKYINNTYIENGVEHIISQEINPNYPGDEKVELAKIFYLAIPQGQASELMRSNDVIKLDTIPLYNLIIYSVIIILIINSIGLWLFSRKELK